MASLNQQYRGNISSIFSRNSEAFASEILENIEEMFPRYYIHSGMLSIFLPSTTQWCVTRHERGNRIVNLWNSLPAHIVNANKKM